MGTWPSNRLCVRISFRIVRAVHQIVQTVDPRGRHDCQRNRDLTVTHRRRGQHCADRKAAIDNVEGQLVADPALLVPLRITFCANRARIRQFGQRHVLLPLQPRQGLGPFFTLRRTLGLLLLFLLRAGLGRALTRRNRGRVPRYMSRQMPGQRFLGQGRVQLARKIRLREFLKRAGEHELRGDQVDLGPATQTAQRRIRLQPIHKRPRGRQVEYSLRQKGPRQRRAIRPRRPTGVYLGFGNSASRSIKSKIVTKRCWESVSGPNSSSRAGNSER